MILVFPFETFSLLNINYDWFLTRQQSHNGNSDASRQQHLRSIRKQEKIALEQELLDRKNLMKAEILADLAVIRNNNNIVLSDEMSKVSSTGSAQTRPVKLKAKRQTGSHRKMTLDINRVSSGDNASTSSIELEKKLNLSHKRKHWSHEGNGRKSRR